MIAYCLFKTQTQTFGHEWPGDCLLAVLILFRAPGSRVLCVALGWLCGSRLLCVAPGCSVPWVLCLGCYPVQGWCG